MNVSLLESVLIFMNQAAGSWAANLVPRFQRWKEIQTGWSDATSATAGVVAWGMGILVVGLLVFVIIHTRREKKKSRERELRYFERKAVDKDLDRKHIKLLMTAIDTVGLPHPYRLLDSYDIFKHLLDEYHDKAGFSEQEHDYFHQQVEDIKEVLGYNQVERAVQIHSTEEVHEGQQINVLFDQGGRTYEYPSEVVHNSDKAIKIDSANIDLESLNINMQTPLHVVFYRESDASYNFTTTLAAAPRESGDGVLEIKHPQKLNRVQARNFSRMDVFFRFSFYYLPKEKFNDVEIDWNLDYCEGKPVYLGSTVDISGGGIAFDTRKKMRKGDYIYLNFQMLTEVHSEPVLAEIVWIGEEPDEDKGENLLLVRAKFFHITDTAQDTLMKFIYQIQRKAARRMKFAPKR